MTPPEASLSDRDQIARVIELYVAGARMGQGETMKPAFNPEATIFGYVGGGPWGGPIQELFTHVDRDGPAPAIRCHIDAVDIVGDVAAVRVEIDNWSGRRYTDLFTLLKTDGAWQIVSKVFHRHCVSESTRADVLWHSNRSMTQHYSVAQVVELHAALEKIKEDSGRWNKSLATLRREQEMLAANANPPNLPHQEKRLSRVSG